MPLEPVVIRGPSALRVTYTDRSALRASGWVVGIAGITGGIVMVASSETRQRFCDGAGYCYRTGHTNAGLALGGVALIVASSIVGVVLASQADRAHLSVEPLRLAWLGGERERERAASTAQGAALAWRF